MYLYFSEMEFRLQFFRALAEIEPDILGVEQVKILWEILVVNAFNYIERDLFACMVDLILTFAEHINE